MTKFNPENKETLSYGECLEPAMKITEQEDANQYFKQYVVFIQKFLDEEPRPDSKTANKTATEIARENLGYFAGYYGKETRDRVKKLFLAPHPRGI